MIDCRRAAARTAGVLVVASLVAGCASTPKAAYRGPQPRSHPATTLARGAVDGIPYVLTAFSSYEGNLCMAVNEGQVPNGHRFAEDGCGFGPPDDRGSSETDLSEADGITLYWGPAPPGAVRVRLDSSAIDAGPASDGTPEDPPSSASFPGCAGREVPEQRW